MNQTPILKDRILHWQAKCSKNQSNDNWIYIGQSYAEELRMWRAQIANAPKEVAEELKHLLLTPESKHQGQRWNEVVQIIINSKPPSLDNYDFWQLFTYVVSHEVLSPVQILCAALIAAEAGNLQVTLSIFTALIEEYPEEIESMAHLCISSLAGNLKPFMSCESSSFDDWNRDLELGLSFLRITRNLCMQRDNTNQDNQILLQEAVHSELLGIGRTIGSTGSYRHASTLKTDSTCVDYIHLHKRAIVLSVGSGPYENRGNYLIERSTFNVLGLPPKTLCYSVFEPISHSLVDIINSHDILIVTGCTTLQDSRWHGICFDSQFKKITIPKALFGAAFCCDNDDHPSLRIADLFDLPIGARDPWTYDYLSKASIPCFFIGCPTLLDQPKIDAWQQIDPCAPHSVILESSTLQFPRELKDESLGKAQMISHYDNFIGLDLRLPGLYDSAALVLTTRLHAALPAIARGIPVKFCDLSLYAGLRGNGSTRYSLLEYLGIPLNGDRSDLHPYPGLRIRELKEDLALWLSHIDFH